MTDLPGAAIVRGPMATDNLTQVHNLAVRGQIIHTRYVGVWAYISSHRQGWRLTEHKIAKDLGVGRDFVRSALADIEAAGCLVRAQERGGNGTFGVSIWFITDLPFQLRIVGITDPDEITTRVQQQYQRWRTRWSGPMWGNPTTSLPTTDSPTSGEPATENPTKKKTKRKNTKTQQHQPASATAAPRQTGLARPPARAGMVGTQPPPRSPGEQLLRSLPATHRLAGHSVGWAAAIVNRALAAGWDPQRITRTLTDHTAATDNPPGVVVARLKELTAELDHAPAAPASPSRPPWCGSCDERSRLVLQADGRMARCPSCNPLAVTSDRPTRQPPGTSSSLTEREGRPGDVRQPGRGR